tara:strand:+ start:17 stop:223 length:207 start_codon:yes stop_codon:yes gene_type:complete
MEVVEVDMVHTTHMVIILLVLVTGVVLNHHLTTKETTLIDTNPIVPGVLVEMDHSMETVEREEEKVLW